MFVPITFLRPRIPAEVSRASKIRTVSCCRMILLLWTWAVLHIAAAHENVTCFQDGQECEGSNDNLVDFAITTSWQECSLLCLNSTDCSAFSFYGPNSDVIPHNSCFLYSDCETKHPCMDCVIGIPQVRLFVIQFTS